MLNSRLETNIDAVTNLDPNKFEQPLARNLQPDKCSMICVKLMFVLRLRHEERCEGTHQLYKDDAKKANHGSARVNDLGVVHETCATNKDFYIRPRRSSGKNGHIARANDCRQFSTRCAPNIGALSVGLTGGSATCKHQNIT